MNIIKISAVTALLSISGFGCSTDSEKDSYAYVDGLLVDMGKFDGCGWVVEYDNCMLEPTNLDEFNIDLADSMSVRFAYVVSKDQVSACMIGTVVDLLDIYEK